MSQRGRDLFEKYVREQFNHAVLRGLGVQSHVHNLLYEAKTAGISAAEIEEDVGPLVHALWLAQSQVQILDDFPQKPGGSPDA